MPQAQVGLEQQRFRICLNLIAPVYELMTEKHPRVKLKASSNFPTILSVADRFSLALE